MIIVGIIGWGKGRLSLCLCHMVGQLSWGLIQVHLVVPT